MKDYNVDDIIKYYKENNNFDEKELNYIKIFLSLERVQEDFKKPKNKISFYTQYLHQFQQMSQNYFQNKLNQLQKDLKNIQELQDSESEESKNISESEEEIDEIKHKKKLSEKQINQEIKQIEERIDELNEELNNDQINQKLKNQIQEEIQRLQDNKNILIVQKNQQKKKQNIQESNVGSDSDDQVALQDLQCKDTNISTDYLKKSIIPLIVLATGLSVTIFYWFFSQFIPYKSWSFSLFNSISRNPKK
ncbi:hypothetical protein ABPG72_020126 [Tetrahymena utriculariae]